MVDRITISKIRNGYVLSEEYLALFPKVKDLYFPTIDKTLEHLKIVFSGTEKETEE